MDNLHKRLVLSIILILITLVFGTVGYMVVEKWNFLDAFYMTIITISSIGYKEVHDLTDDGRIFSIFLIIFALSSVVYAMHNGIKIIMEGELQEFLGRKKLEKKMNELKDHYVICGFGRMGKIICRELKANGYPFIVIEKKPLKQPDDILLYEGDATDDSVLKAVGLERAIGLISVLPTDAENLYVVLSAREINSKLFIVARSGEEGSEQKLLRAGANKVVSPYYIGGLKIAHTIIKPAVVDFIEFATKTGNIDLQMEEISIQKGSSLAGKRLDESGIGRDLNVIIVAIKKSDGEMIFNPTSKTVIQANDKLIALGEIPKLNILEKIASGEK
ncbi:MAG: potassium channel protein [Thermodesulfovibrionales bacterium]|nr:potassium channel protein [Thermodesulfovibrionales bacterium]